MLRQYRLTDLSLNLHYMNVKLDKTTWSMHWTYNYSEPRAESTTVHAAAHLSPQDSSWKILDSTSSPNQFICSSVPAFKSSATMSRIVQQQHCAWRRMQMTQEVDRTKQERERPCYNGCRFAISVCSSVSVQ